MLGNDGVLKVMDFGLVRLQNEQQGLTMTGMIMGTASYLSPEQGQGEACDIRTDIYAPRYRFLRTTHQTSPLCWHQPHGGYLSAYSYPTKPLREIDLKSR